VVSKKFDTEIFLKEVRLVKKDFHICTVKKGNDRYRRRIINLIIDNYLLMGGEIHRAFYLEADLYKQLKKVNLSCDPTPEEIRIRELREKNNKVKHFNPLKLVSENFEEESEEPCPLTKKIINILTKKEKENGFSTNSTRRGTFKTFKYIQKDTRLFKKQKRFSLYRVDQIR